MVYIMYYLFLPACSSVGKNSFLYVSYLKKIDYVRVIVSLKVDM